MKQYNTKNIVRKAYKLLDEHVALFSKKLGRFERQGNMYYLEDVLNGNNIRIGYIEENKLLTKAYNMTIRLTLNNVFMEHDFETKTKFSGISKITTTIFEHKSGNEQITTMLNKDKWLIDNITEIAREVDIISISFKYNADNKILEVTINPYAGAYLWIKFPPAFYGVRLSDDEIMKLQNLIILFRNYFIQDFFKRECLQEAFASEN